MLRKNRILCILLALSMILAMITGCTQNSTKEETPAGSTGSNNDSDYSYHWKLATTEPQDYYMVQLSQRFIDEVNKRTGGKVTGEVFASGQLGNLVGALEGLDMGNVDIVMDGISSLSEVNQMFNVFGIAYLYDSKEHQYNFWDNNFEEVTDIIAEGSGYRLVTVIDGLNRNVACKKPLNNFQDFKGVPTKLWFDNTSTIVAKVLKGGGRYLTDDFIRFMEHYRFKSVFCNVDAGHEKGNVENKVGYHRRNMLVPVPRFDSLSDFNKELLIKCEEDAKRSHYRKEGTIEKLYKDDAAALLELPRVAFDTSKYITVKTNGYGKFLLNKGLHEYSVAPKYANEYVVIKLTASHVIVLDENYREIVRHERLYGNYKQQSMQWLPYLNQLARRPGALKYTGIYQMLPYPLKEYMESYLYPHYHTLRYSFY